MSKKSAFFKLIWHILMIGIGIAIVAPIAFILLFNPNNYKTDIQNVLTEKSGYPLKFNGDISLKLFPFIGLSANDISIDSPQNGTPPLFEAKAIHLKLPIKNLLSFHFRFDSAIIEGGNFYLVQEKNGATNWQIPTKHSKQQSATPVAEDSDPSLMAQHDHAIKFGVALLTVQDGSVTYVNHKSDQQVELAKLNFSGEDLGQALTYPIKGSFDFIISEKQIAQYTGQAKINGTLPKPSNDIYKMDDLSINVKWQDKRNQSAHDLNALLKIAAKKGDYIDINASNARLDKTTLNGNINIPLNNRPIRYDLNINELNLNQWLSATKETDAAKIEHVAYMQTASSSQSSTLIPDSQGTLKIDKLNYENAQAYNISIKGNTKNNNLSINPIRGRVHNGTLNAKVTKNFNQNTPWRLEGRLENANMESLLRTHAQTDRITGRGDFDFQYSWLPNNLSGSTKIDIKNGVIKGLDLDYFYEMAEQLVKKQAVSPGSNEGSTPFNTLTATIMLNNHILTNEDLNMLTPEYHVTGRGNINLNQQSIDYDIKAEKIYRDGRPHPNALPLAVSIKGPLNSPVIQPDMDLYLKLLLEREGKKQLNKNINKHLGRLLDQEDSTNGSGSEQIENKIEKELQKGLKKLFDF